MRWKKTRPCTGSPPTWLIQARAAGRWPKPSNWACRHRSLPCHCSNACVPATPIRLPTSCCRPCATNSAGTRSRRNRFLKEPYMTAPLVIRGEPLLSTAVALLQSQGLPVSDITEKHLEHFFFIGSDDSPTGLVGLEVYGTDALLRSLVVGDNARRKGLGSELVEHAEQYAASK